MDQNKQPSVGQALLAAAMLLPAAVHAETPPERAAISVKYLDYKENQSGLDRIRVHAPSISVLAPVAGDWAIAASATTDDVSGASPRYHTAVSGASRMSDLRKAGDVAVTRYLPGGTVSVGAAFSTEHDYRSRALSLQGTVNSEDKNTTWAFGVGGSDDAINPVNHIVTNEGRQTVNLLAGVTHVFTPVDIGQLTYTHSSGHGYYSDPYKLVDNRPRKRDQDTLLALWNHRFVGLDATSRLSYRYYRDSFGVSAHTLSAEWVQSLAGGWTLTPALRLYSQRAANFYFDPVYDARTGAPFPPGYVFGGSAFTSADQRLSGFGAVTAGVKVAKQINQDWSVDLKLERYEQRGAWRAFGNGSPGLAPLHATSMQIGFTRLW
ncbi:DUF3570 domain-containing protein [Janthinobacterium sp. PC23-8]|uniref:DUF3570 domain-containing protein n=1 Tax=Janthinobacterium sp. PC23-8 TaxID=2012679 RepID=UPI000B96F687|nr:DUF3570 domain-containing protein [Janthinobacterium sp. PC23-8]OYO30352.1 hypothetical protein CD932_03825 [Janthinobacterium sp. PC23-8]